MLRLRTGLVYFLVDVSRTLGLFYNARRMPFSTPITGEFVTTWIFIARNIIR